MERYTHSVLEVCQQLHDVVTGSLVASHQENDELYRWLHMRVETWSSNGSGTCAYDDLVYQLCTQVLAEYSAYMEMLVALCKGWEENGS